MYFDTGNEALRFQRKSLIISMKSKILSDRIKGIRNGLVYYFIGGMIVVLTHIIVGWDYIHAPPASFFILIVVFIGGFVRALWNLINIQRGTKVNSNKYELIVHLLPALAGLIVLFTLIFTN